MKDEATREKVKEHEMARFLAVAANGVFAGCCQGEAIKIDSLQILGIGTPARRTGCGRLVTPYYMNSPWRVVTTLYCSFTNSGAQSAVLTCVRVW